MHTDIFIIPNVNYIFCVHKNFVFLWNPGIVNSFHFYYSYYRCFIIAIVGSGFRCCCFGPILKLLHLIGWFFSCKQYGNSFSFISMWFLYVRFQWIFQKTSRFQVYSDFFFFWLLDDVFCSLHRMRQKSIPHIIPRHPSHKMVKH